MTDVPLQVTFRGFPPSDAIKERVREHADKLSTFHTHITGCRVAIESPGHHHKHGQHYRVRVDVSVPGAEIVVGGDADPSYADAYAAVDGAFRDAARVLREHQKKLQSSH
jgi:ribosomal subunit interface protein